MASSIFPKRQQALCQAQENLFDVILVGGGIIGAGIARDAALRGLKVAVIEKEDFGGGTTAGSTRLIHGGLRYLEQLDFRLVRMDLREREILLKIAPHLVSPLEFFFPFFRQSFFYRWKIRTGMYLYDLLSYDRSLPGHRFVPARAFGELEPQMNSAALQGAASYFDAQVNSPERLCLENLLDAGSHGACLLNYAEATGCIREGNRLAGIKFHDHLSESPVEIAIHGRWIINCTGPWLDVSTHRWASDINPRIRSTKGIHLACHSFNRHAMALFSAVDGRLVFVIPWLGYSWIGTTDTDFQNDPGEASAGIEDAAYLIRSLTPYFPVVKDIPVYFSNSGVRALVRKPGHGSSISRMHRIVDETENGYPGLVSVLGGKITGYRAIAEEVVDLVSRKLNCFQPCQTATQTLPGAKYSTPMEPGSASPEILQNLQSIYGTGSSEVLKLARLHPGWLRPLSPSYPDIAAQVIHAVWNEHCCRISDFMLRRSMLGFSSDQGIQALDRVASLMGEELCWTEAQQKQEIQHYLEHLLKTQSFRDV
jgi:glycerol-3-phosphate dehydrogenase